MLHYTIHYRRSRRSGPRATVGKRSATSLLLLLLVVEVLLVLLCVLLVVVVVAAAVAVAVAVVAVVAVFPAEVGDAPAPRLGASWSDRDLQTHDY